MIDRTISIGIAGTGRVGQTLGRLLSEAGQYVVAVGGRDPERTAAAARFIGAQTDARKIEALPELASHILIAVSDTAVETVACLLAQGGFRRGVALHTCGAKGPQSLRVLAEAGVSCGALHPLQTFASPEQGLNSIGGSFFAIDGDPEAIEWGSSIATLARGGTIRIRAEDRNLYHAAAVMAGNYITALIYGAVEILHAAGVDRSTALTALAPLAKTGVQNAVNFGPIESLTGPIQRGDSTTVMAHVAALRNVPEPINQVYRSAGRLALQMAVLRGLPEASAAEIEKILRTA